jgi:hypothetical protein
MHGPWRTPTQCRITRRIRQRHDGTTTKPPQMHADIRSSVGGARSSRATNDWPTEHTPALEGHNEVPREVERKVLDLHAEVVDDEARLAPDAAGQPRSDEALRRAVILECLGRGRPRARTRGSALRAPPPRGARGRRARQAVRRPSSRSSRAAVAGTGPPGGLSTSPSAAEFDAVLEREGGSDERVELLANLIKSRRKEECGCETPVAMAERERARLRIAGGRGGRGSRRAGLPPPFGN